MQQLSATELCRLAADLKDEHGAEAMTFARRAVASLEAEGAVERAQFWITLCVLLNDINEYHLDADRPQTLH